MPRIRSQELAEVLRLYDHDTSHQGAQRVARFWGDLADWVLAMETRIEGLETEVQLLRSREK
jgi:hypothetical protein